MTEVRQLNKGVSRPQDHRVSHRDQSSSQWLRDDCVHSKLQTE